MPKSDGKIAYISTFNSDFTEKNVPDSCKQCQYQCYKLWEFSLPEISFCLFFKEPTIAFVIDVDKLFEPPIMSEYLRVHSSIINVGHYLKANDKNSGICKEMFELQLRIGKPYGLIFDQDIKDYLALFYTINDNKITIDKNEYTYFMIDEIESRETEILALAQQPYRGIQKPYIVSEEEMKEWIESEAKKEKK